MKTIEHDGKNWEWIAVGKWMAVIHCQDCDSIWSPARKLNRTVCPDCGSLFVRQTVGRWNTYREILSLWKIFSFPHMLLIPELKGADHVTESTK